MADNIPEWLHFEVADRGTYIGFEMGPSAVVEQWRGLVAKWRSRVGEIAGIGAPATMASQPFRQRALTLPYLAQLTPPPDDLVTMERHAILGAGGIWNSLVGAVRSSGPLFRTSRLRVVVRPSPPAGRGRRRPGACSESPKFMALLRSTLVGSGGLPGGIRVPSRSTSLWRATIRRMPRSSVVSNMFLSLTTSKPKSHVF